MSDGLATTFRVLAKTANDSAVRVLLPALDSAEQVIQDGALSALLNRRNPAGQSEILHRIPTLSQRWKYIIQRHAGRLTGSMRDAVLGADYVLCTNACNAAVMFSNYDLIPTLLIALTDVSQQKADLAAETLMKLVLQLYEEIAHLDEHNMRFDPQRIHQHTVTCLEASVQRFGRHRRREVIEAFLILANSSNSVLNQILQNPHHVSFLVMVDVLSRSSHTGVMRLIVDYFDAPQMPSAVMSVASNRCDLKFIRGFLHKAGGKPSDAFRQNIKKMAVIAWLRNIKNLLDNLDEAGQQHLVELVMGSGVGREKAYSTIENILLRGKPGGRREAALALAAFFNGAEANTLAIRALSDADPQVQANVLPQLRRRGIPGILPRLVGMLDSPHLVVRQSARKSLAEFSFPRFLSSFDMLDDEARRNTAVLVKKIDQQAIPLLRKELQSQVRSHRLRGLQVTQVMDVANNVEDLLLDMLSDEDHIVRTEAAATLSKCRSPAARSALEEALHDSSVTVKEAALRSLNELS